jgi:hypothetical protein
LWQAVVGELVAPAERLSGRPDRFQRPDSVLESICDANEKRVKLLGNRG